MSLKLSKKTTAPLRPKLVPEIVRTGLPAEEQAARNKGPALVQPSEVMLLIVGAAKERRGRLTEETWLGLC
jgi:hypothetical protein